MWPDEIATPLVGMGCMRLSTEHDRDDGRAVGVLHAALDAGVTLLDTADAYCWDDADTGHNERLIARALATWQGDRSHVRVATKGGLTRPDGGWKPDGRARHLTSACEASCRALDVAHIDLYQLHAPDPQTSWSTSIRALAALKRAGIVQHIGLCNVTVGQVDEARRIVDIDAVQVELNFWNDDNFLSGVVDHCIRNGIRVIASRPLGGPSRARRAASDPTLTALAARYHATPFEISLAWLADLSPAIVTIPGATRVETAVSIARASHIALTDADRLELDRRSGAAATVRRMTSSRAGGAAAPAGSGEIVLIMGLPAAGKSTLARTYVERGYVRLNRDEAGASLKQLLPAVHRAIHAGTSRIVLDNTYVSRKQRAAVIQSAAGTGLAVRCVWLSTSLEEAQVNAATRMVSKYGRLLGPDDMRRAVKHDISAFGPGVQFRYQRELEPPDASEGFSRVDEIRFERVRDPSFGERALIVWCDGVLTEQPKRAALLRRYADEGWLLLGLGWQPQPADDLYERLKASLGVPIDIQYCPHGGGPPVCWCRKPLPGLGVVFIHKYRLDPLRCVYVGNGPQDPGFARRLGFQYRDADEFFAC